MSAVFLAETFFIIEFRNCNADRFVSDKYLQTESFGSLSLAGVK